MHGDFEAQRHWMEITQHLPVSQWYFYDLKWWGLDYPLLTAYHSWALGKSGSLINSSWFILDKSRALDDPGLKIFMRATVLVSEYLVFVPAAVILVRRFSTATQANSWETSIALLAVLMQPGLILIDHAHFQYNTVMLGFALASFASIMGSNHVWSSVFFVLSLEFKQMTLYFAPAMFAFLLGSCVFPRINIARFLAISIVTVSTLAAVYAPFILAILWEQFRGFESDALPPPPLLKALNVDPKAVYYPVLLQIVQSVHRIFPFSRGLFEDKVANFWCALHTFHKLHKYPVAPLQKLSLVATVLSILPPCLIIGTHPRRTLLPLAAATTAWGFFLFSFQVHEKSVLLPLAPMTFLLAERGGLLPETRAWVAWANILGCWTMYPLLKRDGLRTPYFVLTLLWGWLLGVHTFYLPRTGGAGSSQLQKPSLPTRLLHGLYYAGMIAWHVGEAFVVPPKNLRDIWLVGNVLVGSVGFMSCYLWCLGNLVVKVWPSVASRGASISLAKKGESDATATKAKTQ
ncbi:MAG: Glucosyltransferase-like protein [Alyxoria varia]|nr:MAG: Glucosyltransferase-like protein [Alyxoria varia]